MGLSVCVRLTGAQFLSMHGLMCACVQAGFSTFACLMLAMGL